MKANAPLEKSLLIEDHLEGWRPEELRMRSDGVNFEGKNEIFYKQSRFSSRIFRADGRLVSMSGDFCTNNAQAPSLFSNETSGRI